MIGNAIRSVQRSQGFGKFGTESSADWISALEGLAGSGRWSGAIQR